MDVNNAKRTLTVVMELNLVQVVLMAKFQLPDLHPKLTVDMVKHACCSRLEVDQMYTTLYCRGGGW